MKCYRCGRKMLVVIVWNHPGSGVSIAGLVCPCGHYAEVRRETGKPADVAKNPTLVSSGGASPVHRAISLALEAFGR